MKQDLGLRGDPSECFGAVILLFRQELDKMTISKSNAILEHQRTLSCLPGLCGRESTGLPATLARARGARVTRETSTTPLPRAKAWSVTRPHGLSHMPGTVCAQNQYNQAGKADKGDAT